MAYTVVGMWGLYLFCAICFYNSHMLSPIYRTMDFLLLIPTTFSCQWQRCVQYLLAHICTASKLVDSSSFTLLWAAVQHPCAPVWTFKGISRWPMYFTVVLLPELVYFTALSSHYQDFTVLRRAFLSWSYSQSIFQYYHPREIDFQNSWPCWVSC